MFEGSLLLPAQLLALLRAVQAQYVVLTHTDGHSASMMNGSRFCTLFGLVQADLLLTFPGRSKQFSSLGDVTNRLATKLFLSALQEQDLSIFYIAYARFGQS